MTKVLRDKSKWAKPKSVHNIKGVTHTFNAPCSRAQAIKVSGKVKLKDVAKKTVQPFTIRTFKKDITIINSQGQREIVLPKPLTAKLIDMHSSYKQSKELVQTILEVRMRHPRV